MKIAIVSDSHDNLANIKKALRIINKEKIKLLLHCGDICSPSALKTILEEFNGKVHIVFGNVDGDYFRMTKMAFEEFPKLKVWGELGELKIGGKSIAFLHSPKFAKGLAALSKSRSSLALKRRAATQKYDLVFYGHTHKPWEEKIGKTKLVNPGNLAGLLFRATFAIYDTKTEKLELKMLDENL